MSVKTVPGNHYRFKSKLGAFHYFDFWRTYPIEWYTPTFYLIMTYCDFRCCVFLTVRNAGILFTGRFFCDRTYISKSPFFSFWTVEAYMTSFNHNNYVDLFT
jgi:hypothetical protein